MARDPSEFAAACKDLLGHSPDSIDAPGGGSRDSLRAHFGQSSLYITHRKHAQRARLEATILRLLNQHNAPVPQLIAWRGHWLAQQDVGGRRLTQLLDDSSLPDAADWLGKALSSLAFCQRAAHDSGLSSEIVSLGTKAPWFEKLFDRRLAIAARLDLSVPDLPGKDLMHLLRLREARLIKWDARPGNAVVGEDGEIFWIDWEHAGCRNPLDDVVWLLADEYTPSSAETEEQLLETWMDGFAGDWEQSEAFDYFYTYGVLHSLVRLHYILRYKDDEQWWDHAHCLKYDKVGVTYEHAQRLCERLQRWSAATTLLSHWEPWLVEVGAAITEQ